MERAKIIEMIDSGKIPPEADFKGIQELSLKYPYCSTFKVLLAMGAKEKDDLELKEFINTASIYVQDRSKLYDRVVRDGLLRKIEEGETNSEIAPATKNTQLKATVPKKESSKTETQSQTNKERSQPVIDKDPLEEQIMAAAVMQLGELEVESDIEEVRGKETIEPSEREPISEKPKESFIKGSAFSQFLAKVDHGAKDSQPERAIIEKFISEDRKITPAKKAFFSPTQMGKMSLMEDESFVTETLAKIYERQGDYKKAARAYKNLGLKYPEKRRYFAALQKQAEEQL